MEYFYKNADGDDLLFIHEGKGRLESMFGTLEFHEGDYLVIPRGTIYRIVAASPPALGEGRGLGLRMLVMESPSAVEVPRRYRNEYGQLLEHSPYCERDIRVPDAPLTVLREGEFEVRIKAGGRYSAYSYEHHRIAVEGGDG